MPTLDQIAQQYSRAEITTAWVHDRSTKEHTIIFAVAELCPTDQPGSPRIGDAPHFQVREVIERDVRTLYLRRDAVSPTEALAFFRGGAGGHVVAAPDRPPTLTPAGSLASLTTDEEPVLIESNLTGGAGVGAVLPRRPTSVGVLSKYDTSEATRAWLTHNHFERVVNAVRELLRVDLSRFPEHLGALHLCFSNPLLRRFERSVTADERTLLVRCYERTGHSVVGCEIELSNEWLPVGNGFRVRSTIAAPFFALPMPAQPHHLRVRLFDHLGRCVEDEGGVFLREVAISVGIASQRRITYVSPDGREQESFDVETTSFEQRRGKVDRPRSPLQHLAAGLRTRELDDLATARVFLYFPGGDASRRDALATLRELVGTAHNRCDIIDPYLSADDVATIIPFVRDQGCSVRLLSSRRFLQDHAEDGATRESHLAARVRELRTKLRLSILAKQLKGRERSPVHDRLLVLDDHVFLLGSSLSEFGSRATTIFRVPDPRRLSSEVEIWWNGAEELDPSPNERTLRMEWSRLRDQLKVAGRTSRKVLELAAREVGRCATTRVK